MPALARHSSANRFSLPDWVVALGLLLTALLWNGSTARSAAARMAAVGDHAGDFRLQDLDGRTVQLHKQLKDRAVLVLFTSVGCEPCEASSPALQQVGARFGDRLEVLCVALSELGAVRRWLDAGARFPGARILVGAGGSAPYDTARVYGVLGTPTAFLVGRDGLVYWRHVGRLTDDQVNDEIPGALDAATGGMLTQQGAL